MSVYVDTSAFLAILDADDKFHDAASLTWKKLIEEDEDLLINSFVLVEVHALVQSRLGLEAVRTFFRDIYPILSRRCATKPVDISSSLRPSYMFR